METQANSVFLSGKVASRPVLSHHIYGEGFYTFTLEVPRLSGEKDMLPITVSERIKNGVLLSENESITVAGQIRSYNKIVDGTSRLVLTVFVKHILTACPEERNPNEISLSGYICKPTTYRITPFKREITDILLAVNRAYNRSDYIPLITWGRNARYAGDLKVGDKIKISGRIQSREYEKHHKDGETEVRTAYEVSVSRIEKIS